LAEQVTTKARLPLVCASTSDRTANSAVVPWIFSLLPGNQLQAPVLVEELAHRVGKQSFVIVAGEDHDSRSFAAEFHRHLARSGLAPRFQFTCRSGAQELADVIGRTMGSEAAAVVIVGDAASSALLVGSLREAGFKGPVFGGPSMGRRRFLEDAGESAEGVVFPLLIEEGPKRDAFEAAFRQRFRRGPDYAAAATYDAVEMLVAAVRRAGLNRARIGDAFRELSPWQGTARWDSLGGNTRAAQLGTISGGRIVAIGRAVETGVGE
ncbi:MAG: ABC transporter substrate-binding protein, partial [Thermoguttaceae bacterium]